MRLAALRGFGALDADLDELARALAVAHDLMGEIEQHLVERAAEGGEARVGGVGDLGAPRLAAAPVANSSSVSEVEVSLSTVIALKLRCTALASSACSAGAAIGASVNTKESIVAMSGAIMPAPLAMPLMSTSDVAELRPLRWRPWGKCRWS